MVHNHDLVPHVPPMDVGYHHTPTEVWSVSDGAGGLKYIVCNDSGEDPSCSDSVPATEYSTSDHDVYMGVSNKC